VAGLLNLLEKESGAQIAYPMTLMHDRSFFQKPLAIDS
jgi:hypothetical protein